ncbi:MAG: nuclear transport factor 2 family protein [Alphaproteobacteria bacterium]|jgi:ketosteroid isomerase-like protein|nr:nuclear transport factor 2 family protein [Alphaproteobacteria bacterium]
MASEARAELEKLVIDFTEAFNADDLDGVMSYFADDAVYDEFDGARHVGKEAIRAAFVPQFRGDFGKIRFRAEDMFLDADTGKALISWLCTLETPERAGGWRGLDILHFRDGRLVEKQTYAKTKSPTMVKKHEMAEWPADQSVADRLAAMGD